MTPAEKRIRERLSQNLRRLRKERGLTVEELAHRARLHSRHLQKLEAGETNPTIGTLARLADVLGTPVTSLLE